MHNFCTSCGAKLHSGVLFCSVCGRPVGQPRPTPAPPGALQPAAIQYRPPQLTQLAAPKKADRRTFAILSLSAVALALGTLLVFLVVLLFTDEQASEIAAPKPSPPAIAIPGDGSGTGIISTQPVFETEQTLSPAGGILTIDDAQSALHGLVIDVAQESYDDDRVFTLSSSQIISHGFDAHLKFISPLIHVDNGGGYAKDAMLMTVACVVPEGVIPVAFYYHDDEKRLEYIPILAYDGESVTIGLRHFSTPVIGYFDSVYIDNGSIVETGFVPGVDDFSFVNNGSAITPRGNCFGESVAAIWYYKNLKAEQGSLFPRFDNYGKDPEISFSTRDFPIDDVLAYRLASVSQFLFADQAAGTFDVEAGWRADWKMSRWNAMRTSDQTRFDQLVALIKFNGPQVLLIQCLDEDKVLQAFHAIIAYRVEGNRIYVVDPNKPGQTDRYVEIENGKFKPYSSADNAQDLEAGNEVNYNVFSAFGETAMFDINLMWQLWQDLDERTVGDDHFPEVEVTLTAKIRNAQGDEEDEVITSGYMAKGSDLTFTVEAPADYSWSIWFTKSGDVTRVTPTNKRYTVQLEKEGGYIGVYLLKNKKWYDFKWVPIGLSDVTGIYRLSGTYETGEVAAQPLTGFDVRVELNGTDMKITFLNNSNTVLTGIYDPQGGLFVGEGAAGSAATIVFNLAAQPTTATGLHVSRPEDGSWTEYWLPGFYIQTDFTLTKLENP